jgi:hypothetical protein
MCTVIAASECGELPEALLVGLGEVGLVAHESPLIFIQVAPLFDGTSEDPRFFEDKEGEANDCGIRDWFSGGGGRALDLFDLGPKVCDGVVGVPIGRKKCSIGQIVL